MIKYLFLFVFLFTGSLFGQQIIGKHTGLRVADGKETNWSGIYKFGHNPDVDTGSDPETLWETGGVYLVFPDDSSMDIVSSSAADDAGSTGAITVRIFGVDSSFVRNQEDIILNGQTEVVLANKYRVIYRAVVLTAGTGDTNAGALTIATTTASGAKTLLTVAAAEAQSQIGVFPVAAGERAFIMNWGFSQKTASVDLELELMVYRVDDTNGGVWNTIDLNHSRVTGNSAGYRNWSDFPQLIVGPAIIKIEIIETSTDNADVSGHFTILYR